MFPLAVKGIHTLFFKGHGSPFFLKRSHIVQRVQGIAGKRLMDFVITRSSPASQSVSLSQYPHRVK
ncbi:Hypothetical protein DEACI_1304 [Acididesulfobacillus acetoxydans]|uniref:Uncharacterized protein n=1 Tax=Acididesulfobacillus acetoxydans TaxID=1561005 RepID=A0A8S0WX09_9FIRM|nr:Hypothetical protein DEACI_1304 [Acididesulfobacillus acetoxydans]CEJ09432.1 Hypothetical protein DEACI_3916 [Acididesulfobacillus acetoxydans]